MASSSRRPRQSSGATPRASAPTRRRATVSEGTPVFSRRNYTLLGGALALIVLGYAIMRADNTVDGPLSLTVSPILLLAGYLGVIYAILWRPKTAPRAEAVA